MIAHIFIALFLVLLFWILFGPVMVKINTDRKLLQVSLPGVVTARLLNRNEHLFIRLWIFFLPLRIDPFKSRNKVKSPEKEKKKRRTGSHGPGFRMGMQKMKRAVRIRRMELDLDTDDFPLNARLVPVFSAINTLENIDLRVNFEGRLSFKLDVRTRIAALIWMLITK